MTETVMRTDGAAIGRADRRKEDARLLTGRTNWTDNIQLPGTLHMACLRSSMAHAKILGIDASAAGYKVGYESPSQFSREYSRLFGAPPVRDLARLRAMV